MIEILALRCPKGAVAVLEMMILKLKLF